MIYYSHRTRKALAENRTYLPLGFAHYSYGTVCRKFLDIFGTAKLATQELLMPEIYPSASQIFPPSPLAKPLHIAFKPYEEIRLLKGAANVAHVAWEFDKLPQLRDLPNKHQRRSNVLNDYVHILGLVSEVWVGCTYTKAVFEAHGLKNVQIVPAPIAVHGEGRSERRRPNTSFRRIGSLRLTQANVSMYVERGDPSMLDGGTMFHADDCRANGGRVFLSILNPGDPRKNAAALILGFQEFLQKTKRNDLLIIKLVLDGMTGSMRKALSDHLPKYCDDYGIPLSFVNCGNILLVRDPLAADELAALYEAADFYICTSGAEGQGLPVQEAMAAGAVPISSRETAMADYIDEENALIMHAEDAPIPLQISNAYGLSNLGWRIVTHREVSRALYEAVSLSPAEYAKRSQAAVDTIRRLYGYEHVTSLVVDRLKALVA